MKTAFQIIRKKELASTNSYAAELLQKDELQKPTVILAESQVKGRGQGQNQWFSEKGKSLTLSVVVFPEHIKAERQFVLSQVVCLAIWKTFSKYTSGVKIKWPNDMFINDVKCCGVLIENAIMGDGISHSVCGVGLNINNLEFVGDYAATSLRKESKKEFDLEIILQEYLHHFQKYYALAEKGEYALLNALYHENLFKKGEILDFEDKDGVFRATVVGIDQYGQLLLEDYEKQLRTYGFKEVEWILGHL